MATKINPNQPLHPSFDERVSVKVDGQLPDFVTRDHPTFVAFLEAYYEYMEQEGKPYEIIGNLNNYANIGKTTDEFLKYFKNQFAIDIPELAFSIANKPMALKRLRDFYRAKGSEKSFKFFFRLLYNQEIDMYYPSVDILRTSDGRYDSSSILRCIDNSGNDNVFKLQGKKITGLVSNATALVESVLNETVGSTLVSTIYLSGTNGDFISGETITDDTYSFVLGQMLTDINISVEGNGYGLGDNIPIIGGGIISSGAVAKISKLSAGYITSVAISQGGSGYVVGDKFDIDNVGHLDINGRTMSLLVSSVDVSGVVTGLTLENMGRGYTSLPTISGGSGTGFVPTMSGKMVGGIEKISIDNHGYGFISTPTLDLTGFGDGTAVATTSVGAYVGKYKQGFSGDNGFLSANKYIQDSHYYQLYSYVITVGETIDKWRSYVKRAVHPVGLAMFGRLQLISNIKTNLRITDIPSTSRYTIIFHDGTIIPPVRLNLKIDSCEGEITWVVADGTSNENEYGLISEADDEQEDFGLVSEASGEGSESYGMAAEPVSTWTLPTRCQTYEQELGVQTLLDGGFDDYLFVNLLATRYANFGLLHESTDNPENYGLISEGMSGGFSQLRLGPLKRTLDRLKFNSQGGYSQIIGTLEQSGTIISNFKDEKVSEYIFFSGRKQKKLTNATITHFTTADEATWPAYTTLPFS
jgi:hypothetical protein